MSVASRSLNLSVLRYEILPSTSTVNLWPARTPKPVPKKGLNYKNLIGMKLCYVNKWTFPPFTDN